MRALRPTRAHRSRRSTPGIAAPVVRSSSAVAERAAEQLRCRARPASCDGASDEQRALALAQVVDVGLPVSTGRRTCRARRRGAGRRRRPRRRRRPARRPGPAMAAGQTRRRAASGRGRPCSAPDLSRAMRGRVGASSRAGCSRPAGRGTGRRSPRCAASCRASRCRRRRRRRPRALDRASRRPRRTRGHRPAWPH